MLIEASKLLFKLQRPLPPGRAATLANALHWFAAILVVNYLAVAFLLLEVSEILAAWSNLAWSGHALLGAMLAIGLIGPKLAPKPRAEEVEAKEVKKES